VSDTGTSPRDQRAIVAVAVMVVGTLLLMHGCTRFLTGGGHVLGAEEVEGTIVEVVERQVDFGRGRGPARVLDVYVEYPIGAGRTLRVRDGFGGSGDNPAKGKTVKVYFDKQAPERAMVGGSEPMTGIHYLIEWLAGIAAIVASIFMLLRLTRRRRKAIAKEG
jgi:hypothetical protein